MISGKKIDAIQIAQQKVDKEFWFLHKLPVIDSYEMDIGDGVIIEASTTIINGTVTGEGCSCDGIADIDECIQKTKTAVMDLLESADVVYLRKYPEIRLWNGLWFIRARFACHNNREGAKHD